MSPGQRYPDFDWTKENGLIRAGLLGLLNQEDLLGEARDRLVEIIEIIVSEMDADSKLVFRRRVIEPAMRGEEPAHFQIRRGSSGRYELSLD